MRDLPRSLKHVTVWLLLLAAVFLAVQYWHTQQRALQARANVTSAKGWVEIQRAEDGMYYWPGTLQGEPVVFLVDTGATVTSIPQSLADRLGLDSIGHMVVDTANGKAVVQLAKASLALEGRFHIDAATVTSSATLAQPLIGMNVLRSLNLQLQNGVLRITLGSNAPPVKAPPPPPQ